MTDTNTASPEEEIVDEVLDQVVLGEPGAETRLRRKLTRAIASAIAAAETRGAMRRLPDVEEIAHEEQLVIWADDLWFGIQGWLNQFDDYDDCVQFRETLKRLIKSNIKTAFDMARRNASGQTEASTPSDGAENHKDGPIA